MSSRISSIIPFGLAVLAAVAALPSRTMAQTRPEYLVQIGFSRSTIGGDTPDGLKSRSGFFGGVGIGLTSESGLGFRAEVNYDQKGVELPQDTEVRYGVQLGYVDVPLLVRYVVGNDEDMTLRPAIFLGPSIGFEVDCQEQELDTASGFYNQVACPSGTRHGTMVDAVAGFELGISHFVVGVRYSYGFTELLKDPAEPSLKNRMWALALGYTF
jgi:hypothetical protein